MEHFYGFQKELIEKLIASKDQEITNLKGIIDNFLKQKSKEMIRTDVLITLAYLHCYYD